MTKTQKRLGRGLSSLVASELRLEDAGGELPQSAARAAIDRVAAGATAHRLMSLPVDQIRRNPMQPRRAFDEDALASLAESLRDKGALQPIVVRPAESGYELVAGERRLRAAKIAGLRELPAIVRGTKDEELLELALVENIQRADLNPVDRARGYRALQDRFGLSHEEIAGRMGEDRTTVTNYLRLLELPDGVLEMLADGWLSTGHAKALLGTTDNQARISLASKVRDEGWSVRRLEKVVAASKTPKDADKPSRQVRPAVRDLEELLSIALGTRVEIHEGRRRHTGRIFVQYSSLDDFQRIASKLGVVEDVE
ncbi:MAG: ParB/RepB/Spo0J family partition protein [Planctomycetota bacterium]